MISKKLLLMMFITFSFVTINGQTVNLPKKCLKILNQKFRGWQIAKITVEEGVVGHNLLKGDWNGDGQPDYAILINKGKIRQENGNYEDLIFTIAFIKTSGGYAYYKLEGGDSIFLMKKGQRDYDYDSGKNFIYKNDAIFVGTGCCGSSNIWRKGKFISIVTSD